MSTTKLTECPSGQHNVQCPFPAFSNHPVHSSPFHLHSPPHPAQTSLRPLLGFRDFIFHFLPVWNTSQHWERTNLKCVPQHRAGTEHSLTEWIHETIDDIRTLHYAEALAPIVTTEYAQVNLLETAAGALALGATNHQVLGR